MKPKMKYGQKVRITKEGFYKDRVGKGIMFYSVLFRPFYTVQITKGEEVDVSEKHLEQIGKQAE